MKFGLRYVLAWLYIVITFSLSSNVAASDLYVGSQTCQSCHSGEYQAWQTSHHFQSMQPATSEHVLGAFAGESFDYAGLTHEFFQRDDEYWVTTDNAHGELQDFKVEYVFGFYPLQQYLIRFPDGRLQTLSISWDSRPQEEGGQRWFHLYPDENVTADDPLHWTGYLQNWNSRCASCHSTNLTKGYDPSTNTFDTQYSEVNVGCESCHGPARDHLTWAQNPADGGARILSLKDRGNWTRTPTQSIAYRQDGQRPHEQVEVCAACHSLRDELTTQHMAGASYHDDYELRLLEEPYYQTDGQIRDEVYVYGSFLQSKMAEAGVVCADCHNPHSGNLVAEGNGLCLQCHAPESYQTADHIQHSFGTPGSECVDCHMPETVYMEVDPRRDHSFSVPNAMASLHYDVGNACDRCHTGSVEELAALFTSAYGETEIDPYLQLVTQIRAGDRPSLPDVINYVKDSAHPGIRRATLLLELVNFPSRAAFETSMEMIRDEDPLVRRAALNSLSYVPVDRRNGYVSFLNDGDASVRMTLAPFLAPMPTDRLPEVIDEMYSQLLREFILRFESQADMPSQQLALANFYLSLGSPMDAEAALEQSLIIAPSFVPAMLNKADLQRLTGREDQAMATIQSALNVAPESAEAHHALGLLYVRRGDTQRALSALKNATVYSPESTRYRYVYAVALESVGEENAAIEQLQRGLESAPYDGDSLAFIITLLDRKQRVVEAAEYRSRLNSLRAE